MRPATRHQVMEETGFDLEGLVSESDYIEMTLDSKRWVFFFGGGGGCGGREGEEGEGGRARRERRRSRTCRPPTAHQAATSRTHVIQQPTPPQEQALHCGGPRPQERPVCSQVQGGEFWGVNGTPPFDRGVTFGTRLACHIHNTSTRPYQPPTNRQPTAIQPPTNRHPTANRQEIGGYSWYRVADLPSTKEESNQQYQSADGSKIRFYAVRPFFACRCAPQCWMMLAGVQRRLRFGALAIANWNSSLLP
jgi:hypothetical protein